MRLLDLLNTIKAEPEPLLETLAVLLYEMGDLAKAVMRAQWEPDLAKGYRGEEKIALGDIYVQWQLICETRGFEPEEIKQLGIEHFEDRIEERRGKGQW